MTNSPKQPPVSSDLLQTRADQLCRILKRDLKSKVLPSPLPGERQLSDIYHVGRNTVRDAIKQLIEENVLRRGENKRVSAKKNKLAGAGTLRWKTACLLTKYSFHEFNFHELCWVDLLRERMAAAGLLLKIIHRPDLFLKDSHWHVEQIVHDNPAAIWLLHRSPQAIQQSIETIGVPAIICGTAHEGITIPNCDLDQRAIGQFIANLLARRGYSHIFVTDTKGTSAGRVRFFQALKEGILKKHLTCTFDFSESFTEASVEKIKCQLARHNRQLAIVTGSGGRSLKVMTALLAKGIRFPVDAGLLCLDGSPYLEQTIPPTAHFHYPSARYASMVSRLILRIVRGNSMRSTSGDLLPDFVDGGTLWPA
jgi:hypothetical protein